ncbi:MAG: hypothetical protein AAGF78_11090 [Pseudomonadota bacterium]
MARKHTNGSDAETNIADVAGQIETLKADIAELTEALGGIAESKAAQARQDVRQAGASARDRATDLGRAAQEQAMEGAAALSQTARQNPTATLGLVAAAGFALGFLMARK